MEVTRGQRVTRLPKDQGWAPLFWQAFKGSTNPMVLVDDRRVPVEVNGAFVALLGYKRSELIGRPLHNLLVGGPLFSSREWADLLTLDRFSGVAELVCHDGRRVKAEFSGHPEVVTGRRLILVVAIPILLLTVGQVALRMHPQFTKMQNRIDRVNQVLREQISGMRVVRAFVREPDEAARFGMANADLTETSLKTGRMMAIMFPAVLLTINLSSVAAVWFGADRIGAGQMQVGSLVAFLSYLIQILMAVMMGTWVFMMGPRASVMPRCISRMSPP